VETLVLERHLGMHLMGLDVAKSAPDVFSGNLPPRLVKTIVGGDADGVFRVPP
jgi:hypothetical protein